jgi:hypothetical protein
LLYLYLYLLPLPIIEVMWTASEYCFIKFQVPNHSKHSSSALKHPQVKFVKVFITIHCGIIRSLTIEENCRVTDCWRRQCLQNAVLCVVALGLFYSYYWSLTHYSLLLHPPFMYYVAYLFVFAPFLFCFQRTAAISHTSPHLQFFSQILYFLMLFWFLVLYTVKWKREFFPSHFWNNTKNCMLCQK